MSSEKPETKVISTGRMSREHFGAVNTPVYRASTILFPDVASMAPGKQPYSYGRRGTPSSDSLEKAIGALEGGGPTPLGLACEEMIATTGRFLAESQAAGLARPEVTAQDLVGCAAMLAWLGSTGPQGTRQADGARDILRHGYKIAG